MSKNKLAKIELSGFDELSYWTYDLESDRFKSVTLPRGIMLSRRKKVSEIEKETGSFDPADGCDMVERWLHPCEELPYIHSRNQITGNQQYYAYDAAANEFIPADKKKIKQWKEEIAQSVKKRAALAMFCGQPIEKMPLVKEALVMSFRADDGREQENQTGPSKQKLGCIDYIATNEKVFCYDRGEWVAVEPETIFYRIEGTIKKRRAQSYLPCRNTLIKVLRHEYENPNVSRSDFQGHDKVSERYYLDDVGNGRFLEITFQDKNELRALERELAARQAAESQKPVMQVKNIFQETI